MEQSPPNADARLVGTQWRAVRYFDFTFVVGAALAFVGVDPPVGLATAFPALFGPAGPVARPSSVRQASMAAWVLVSKGPRRSVACAAGLAPAFVTDGVGDATG